MSDNLKKILQILALALTAITFGFLLYFFFFRTPSAVELAPRPSGQVSGLPTVGTGAPKPTETGGRVSTTLPGLPTFIGSRQVGAPTDLTSIPAKNIKATGNSAAYYDPANGEFLRVTPDGNTVKLTDKKFYSVQKLDWAPKADKAVLEFPDGSNIVYNFSSGTQTTLPAHWQDFSFSANGEQIIAKSIGQDVESRKLVVTNADGSGKRAIADLGDHANDVIVSWSPNEQIVAFSKTGDARDGSGQEIIPIGQNQENYRALIVPGYGFQGDWSPNGGRLLFSVYNANSDFRPELYIASGAPDSIGGGRQSLRIQTFADKCTFANEDVLFCAVPVNLPRGAALERSIADQSPDSVYRIDLKTGSQIVVVPPGNSSVSNLQVSGDGNTLFYQDNASGILKKVSM